VTLLDLARRLAERDYHGHEAVAWLLYSRLLDRELWILGHAEDLDAIGSEIAGQPVFFAEELAALRGRPAKELETIADAKAVFGAGTRVIAGTEA
jgi:hypothetical protein